MNPAPAVAEKNTKSAVAAKSLLLISELGVCERFQDLFQESGYSLTIAPNRRKALNHIKNGQYSVIATDFVFSPTYGSQLSNLESLFGASETKHKPVRFLVFIQQEEVSHFEALGHTGLDISLLIYPCSRSRVKKALELLGRLTP